jgi:hypothetical protein
MPAPSKRAKQQAAKLQAGLLAGKGAPRNGDAGDADAALEEAPEHAPSPAEPAKAVKAPLKADDIFYGKGAATAATFRPWSYDEKPGGPEGTHDAGAAPANAEAPPSDASADAKILQERLAEKATAVLGTEPAPAAEAAAPAALAEPTLEDAAPSQTAPTPDNGAADPRVALSAEPAPVEAQAGAPVSVEPAAVELMAVETPAAEPSPAEPTIIEAISVEALAEPASVEAFDAEPAPVEPTIIESPSIEAAESAPVEPTVIESLSVEASVEAPAAESLPVETPVVAAQPEPTLEAPEPEAPQERPHQRARRALREQAIAAEVVVPPPPAPAKRRKAASTETDDAAARAAEDALAAEEHAATLAAEERVAALAAEERAAALAEEARAAALAEEERLAAARAAADAAPASSDDLAATIETALGRRRYTDPVDFEKARRSGSGLTITGNSLLAELQAAREARGDEDAGPIGESDAPPSASSRPLLDRVLAFGGIALILVVAFLALSPAAQYAPVARLTHLFN